MRILELFCGTKSISKVFEARGYEVITLDNEPKFNPTICKNILEFDPEKDLPEGWKPDIIWASPPCTTFSVASISRYWDEFSRPKNHKSLIGMAIAMKTTEIIKELNPQFWFIENPRGMLRQQFFMERLPRKTVTYCQYGHKVQKPTDIWTNCFRWIPRPMCSPGDSCYEKASRGAKAGIQGIYASNYYDHKRSAEARAIIPEQLCQEIVDACEGKQRIKQTSLTIQQGEKSI